MEPGERYLEISQQIKELEAEKKVLASMIPMGWQTVVEGERLTWGTYDRTSTTWKGLFEQAYSMLDDGGQVIMGEARDAATKTSTHMKFLKDQ